MNHEFDIEIMLLTYNRKDFFKKSLQSILDSTVKGLKITVVDNASTDGTVEYVKGIIAQNPNIKLYQQEKNVGQFGNFMTAKSLATAKYVMIFHDDDLIHPQYLESVLRILQSHPNTDLICSDAKLFTDDEKLTNEFYKTIPYQVYTPLDFISLIFINKWGKHLNFPNIVYKTENLRDLDFDVKMYGKPADRPLALSTIKNGDCIFIKAPMLNCRQHEGQDTHTLGGPFIEEIINHNNFFKVKLEQTRYSRLIFNIHSFYWLRSFYAWGRCGGASLKELVSKAYNAGAISLYTYLMFSPLGIILKPVNYVLKKLLKVKYTTTQNIDTQLKDKE